MWNEKQEILEFVRKKLVAKLEQYDIAKEQKADALTQVIELDKDITQFEKEIKEIQDILNHLKETL